MTEDQYLTAVYSFNYFGPQRVNLLLKFFKSAKNIWLTTPEKLIETGLSNEKVISFEKYRNNFDIKIYFEKLKKLEIKVVTFLDDNYPQNLEGIDGAPLVLYYKGTLKKNDINSVAIVGSRKMTSYGREVAELFSGQLANFGVTIISGLARGIDTVAHKACLANGGRTIAVLGNGLDSVYPSENIFLANEIIKNGGAIISEYPLGYPALPVNFAIRNRIVSGLSTAVIVIEGAEKSGTLITASNAAEQSKTVFTIPGQITSPLSYVPLFLLKNGAKIATSPKDIMEELDFNLKINPEEVEKVMPDTPEQEKILEILSNEPLHMDELVRISKMPTSVISARLTIMEMKGMVKNMGRGIYRKI